MNKKTVIIVSAFFVLLITGLIIVLSFSGPDNSVPTKAQPENQTALEHLASSDATPGENNEGIERKIKPEEVAGYYVDKNDGWYYSLIYSPTKDYAGTFSGGFDPAYRDPAHDVESDVKFTGEWALENGEIKLYSNGQYHDSIWSCGDYIVDSKNYFVGDIDPDSQKQQSMFVCKVPESGDAQIINLYSDGKAILEIIKDSGEADSSAQPVKTKEMYAGTYEIKEDIILITMSGSTRKYYIVNDGFAKWIYNKV